MRIRPDNLLWRFPLALPFQVSLTAQQCGAMTDNVEQPEIRAEPPSDLQPNQTDAAKEQMEASPKKEQPSTTMVTTPTQEPTGMHETMLTRNGGE